MTRSFDGQPPSAANEPPHDAAQPSVEPGADRSGGSSSPTERTDGDEADEHDPFAPVEASPRFATPLALVGVLLGIVAAFGGLAPLAGPVGMGVALVAHVKGSRLGLPAAGVAAVGMIIGMAVAMYLR